MNKLILIALLPIMLGASCKKKDKEPQPHYQTLIGNVDFVKISAGFLDDVAYLDNANPQIVTITNKKQWENFVSDIHRHELKNEVDIDFSTHQILGIFDHQYADRSSHFQIVSMEGNQNEIVVKIKTTKVSDNNEGNTPAIVVRPYHVVKILQTQQTKVLEEVVE